MKAPVDALIGCCLAAALSSMIAPVVLAEDRPMAESHLFVLRGNSTRARLADLVAAKSRTIPEIVVVSTRVKNFSARFQEGFGNPESTLKDETALHPVMRAYIQDWLNTPSAKESM